MQQVDRDSIIAPSVNSIENMKLRPLRTAFVIGIAIIALSACLYRVEVRQGNYIEAATLEQLEIGMSKSQVRFLLGSPAIIDLYQPELWHYAYTLQDGTGQVVDKRKMILSFTDDLLTTIDGDFSPG